MHKEPDNTSVLVKVQELKYITTPSGRIVCVLVLTPDTYVTLKSGEDSITYEILRLNDLAEVKTLKVNVGQILDVNFTYTTINDVKMEFVGYRVEMRSDKIPYLCTVCGSKLNVEVGNVSCSGYLCQAKSRTPLMYLYSQAFDFMLEDKDYAAFEKYLDNFPTYDGHSSIYNIIDFVRVFKSLGTVDIQRRADILESMKLPEEVHEFELELWNRIKQGYYKKYLFQFWDLLPMVKNNRNLYPILSTLSPGVSDLSNQLIALPVDDITKDDFIANIHHIKALFSELAP